MDRDDPRIAGLQRRIQRVQVDDQIVAEDDLLRLNHIASAADGHAGPDPDLPLADIRDFDVQVGRAGLDHAALVEQQEQEAPAHVPMVGVEVEELALLQELSVEEVGPLDVYLRHGPRPPSLTMAWSFARSESRGRRPRVRGRSG